MNLVIKSSIITLLTTAAVSSVSASICIDTGNDAAELVILENWCEPDFFSKGSPTPEERCRKVAIRTCQSGTTLRGIINDWCPDKQPSNADIFNLGDYCEDTVDGLIGTLNEASFVSWQDPWWPTLTREECNRDEMCTWCDDNPDFFQDRFNSCVERQTHRDCLGWAGCCGGSLGGTSCGLVNEASASLVATKTKAKYDDYESSFVSKASKTRKPTRSPTRPPTPDSPVVSGFRAGQQAMQQWWKDEGSSCSNAWSGIINPVANEIKNSQFPNKGSSNTRARNKSAQLGVDSEVRSIQEKCFSADADEFIAAPAPIELDPLAAPTTPSPVPPPLELHPTPRFVAAPEPIELDPLSEPTTEFVDAPAPIELDPNPNPAPKLEMSRRALRGQNN